MLTALLLTCACLFHAGGVPYSVFIMEIAKGRDKFMRDVKADQSDEAPRRLSGWKRKTLQIKLS